MPWNNQNDNGNRPRKGPWGQEPPSGGGGMRPNDLDDLFRRLKEQYRRLFGDMGRKGWTVAGIAVLGLWLLSGFYIVDASEQGVVLRFGAFIRHTEPGINYHLPWPIETAYTPNVTMQRQVNIGYRILPDKGKNDEELIEDVSSESLMLTGDENIVDVNFTVNWQVKDANAYQFNVADPDDAVKAVAESAMREVAGQEHMDLIMTSHREQVQQRVQKLMQDALDSYHAGIVITGVKMRKADQPFDVREAYLDVQKALADQDKKRNEAEAYANTIIPQARGEATQIVQDAEAYRQRVIAEATGEAKRFLSVYQEYKKAPEVTRRRMYYETMSQVLGPMNKIIVDDAAKGVVPYFQLPPLAKTLPPAKPNAPATNANPANTLPGSGQ